jgi:hypothetical protein
MEVGLFDFLGRKTSTKSRDESRRTAADSAQSIPKVRFDALRHTDAVIPEIVYKIRNIPEFDDSHFDRIYNTTLNSITRGRNLALLYNAIMELNLPVMTKQRASEISCHLNDIATTMLNRDRENSLGITMAKWVYSGAPCHINPKNPSSEDIRRDNFHKAENGRKYDICEGLLIDGRLTMPGRDSGCKCFSRPIIPGLD